MIDRVQERYEVFAGRALCRLTSVAGAEMPQPSEIIIHPRDAVSEMALLRV